MEITQEQLDQKIADYTKQRENNLANANALTGAIQALQDLKDGLSQPAISVMPDIPAV